MENTKINVSCFRMNAEHEKKLKEVLLEIRKWTPFRKMKINFLKTGRGFEYFFSARVGVVPVGFYQRGTSVSSLLDGLLKKAKKEGGRLKKHVFKPEVSAQEVYDATEMCITG